MATIKNTLALEDKMSKTLLNITSALKSTLNAMQDIKGAKIGESFKQAQRDIQSAENAIKNFGGSANLGFTQATSGANSFFKAILGADILKKTLSTITSEIGGAVSRFDTLNNYPKMMKNLGIDESQSKASLVTLSEGLKNIPTRLNDAASSVARFTSKNKNIEASTKMFLALNNAILAGGADMGSQSSALEQLSQAYAKGKPDMMEWRTALQAMPAQLDQVARYMGKADATQLGEELRKGKVSMNELMIAMMHLNEEGIDGLDNFAKQAENATGGIATNLANMKSAVQRGVISIIDAINEILADFGFKNGIADLVKEFGKFLENTLKKIATLIKNIYQTIKPLLNFVLKAITAVYNFIVNHWELVKAVILGVIIAMESFKVIMSAVAGSLIAATLAALGFNSQMLITTLLVGGCALLIAAFIATLFYLWNTNDEVAYAMLLAWDSLYLGLASFGLGAKMVFYGILDAISYMKIAGIGIVAGFIDFIIEMINELINLLNKIPGVSIDTIEGIGDKAANDMLEENEKIRARAQELAEDGAAIAEKTRELNESRQQRVADRKKVTKESIAEEVGLGGASIDDLAQSLDDVTTSDGKGGKSVKTKNTDKLLSDEDIQLLLDVATRDYQLNYQQVTPNVTVTFGDVRETADVDQVLEVVGTRVEEIINGDGALEY